MGSSAEWRVTNGHLGAALRDCLLAAIAAPSIHNTQPWRFRPRPGGVDVFADHSRRLAVLDPRGREVLISVGAALLNLRVAILAHGRIPVTRVLPMDGPPDLVARVEFGPATPVTSTVRMLAEAIPRRHTNRRPYLDASLPANVVSELVEAAAVEGGHLALADPPSREAILGLVRLAESLRRREPSYWRELSEWTRMSPGRRDGVPPEAYGPWSAMETVPIRDFGLVEPARRRTMEEFESEPTIATLYTASDSPRSWIQAGQSLERLLLTATVRGVATSLMTQPLEIPHLRAMLVDSAAALVPQVILRFGYGPPSAPTPRRPLAEVVDGLTTSEAIQKASLALKRQLLPQSGYGREGPGHAATSR